MRTALTYPISQPLCGDDSCCQQFTSDQKLQAGLLSPGCWGKLHFRSGSEPIPQPCVSVLAWGLSQRGSPAADGVKPSPDPASAHNGTGTEFAHSRWHCPTPDMTCLLYLPIFPAGSGNIYFINICKELKISLLFCHKLILLCL